MELQFYGANCLKLMSRKAHIVIDDNLTQLGQKKITKPTDILLRTSDLVPSVEASFIIDSPGEYELADVAIHGIAARAHMDDEDKQSTTIYIVSNDELSVCFAGHIYPDLSEGQLEQIGRVDILVIPVGGSGYTLDGVGALKIIKKIEPKVVIPVHYADKALKFEVPQANLDEALKGMSMEPAETLAKYKPKIADLTDTTKLVILERQ